MARNSKKRRSHSHRRPHAGAYAPRLDRPIETPTGGNWLRWRRRRSTRIRPVG